MTTYRALEVTIDGEIAYPCVVALGDGSQPMTDTARLGWAGDPIPRWNGWIAYPLFDRATVERIMADMGEWPDSDRFAWANGPAGVVRDGSWSEDPALILTHGPDYETSERIEPEDIDGTPRWCVGGCSWVWSEYESDSDHEARLVAEGDAIADAYYDAL